MEVAFSPGGRALAAACGLGDNKVLGLVKLSR